MKHIDAELENIFPTHLELDETDLIEIQDETVRQAALQYQQTGSLLPIVKMELKCKILQNRLSRGEGEIEIDFTPRKPGQLSPEEIERRNKRKESNRLSARRSRMKKKSSVYKLQKEVAELEARNIRLRKELHILTEEKSRLLTFCSSCSKPPKEFSSFNDTIISESVTSALRTIINMNVVLDYKTSFNSSVQF